MLNLNGVTKTYTQGDETRVICRDLTFALAAGERVAIFGRSGIGKSTLINLMCGIDLPDHGEIHFDGTALAQLSDKRRTLLRRRGMGIVFQFFNLIPTLTALENVLLPLSLNGLLTETRKQEALALLETLQLEMRAQDFPEHLSGGEQQRVAIARALVHHPKVVFADEPTGNLDTQTATDVMQMLQDLAKQHQTTLLIVSHNEQVRDYVDSAYRMQDGTLVLL